MNKGHDIALCIGLGRRDDGARRRGRRRRRLVFVTLFDCLRMKVEPGRVQRPVDPPSRDHSPETDVIYVDDIGLCYSQRQFAAGRDWRDDPDEVSRPDGDLYAIDPPDGDIDIDIAESAIDEGTVPLGSDVYLDGADVISEISDRGLYTDIDIAEPAIDEGTVPLEPDGDVTNVHSSDRTRGMTENVDPFSQDGVRPRFTFISAIGRFEIEERVDQPPLHFPPGELMSYDDDSTGAIRPPFENQWTPQESSPDFDGSDISYYSQDYVEEGLWSYHGSVPNSDVTMEQDAWQDGEGTGGTGNIVEETIMRGVSAAQAIMRGVSARHARRSARYARRSARHARRSARYADLQSAHGLTEDREVAIDVAVAPVPINEDAVPDDLICSICMALPVDPILTPGDYMFCRSCIHTSLMRKEECPVTRSHCCALCIQSPEGFVRRLWSSVQVKCGHHGKGCTWTGSVADYPAHLEMCTATSNHPNPDHLEKCTETSDQVRTKDLTSELRRAKEAHSKALEEIGRLERENAELVSSLHKAIHRRKPARSVGESIQNTARKMLPFR